MNYIMKGSEKMDKAQVLQLLLLDKRSREAVHILPLYYTGAKLCDLADALPVALRKLDLIIKREGDADGARIEPKYLAMLIAEVLRSQRIQRETLGKEKKHEAEAVALLVNAHTV